MGVVDETASNVAVKISASAGYGGAAAAVIGGWSANDIAMIGGLIVGTVGMIGNLILVWWFKHQHLQLAKARLAADLSEQQEASD